MNLRNFATHWTTTTLHEELSKLKSRLPNASKIIKSPDDKFIEEKPFEEEIITYISKAFFNDVAQIKQSSN